jgi:hypothetical protein
LEDPRALDLKRALYDGRDTAVTQAAAEELLARFDDVSQEALAEASRSEDADVARTGRPARGEGAGVVRRGIARRGLVTRPRS